MWQQRSSVKRPASPSSDGRRREEEEESRKVASATAFDKITVLFLTEG